MRHWLPIVLLLLAHGPSSPVTGARVRLVPGVVSTRSAAVVAAACELIASTGLEPSPRPVAEPNWAGPGPSEPPVRPWRAPGTEGAPVRAGPAVA